MRQKKLLGFTKKWIGIFKKFFTGRSLILFVLLFIISSTIPLLIPSVSVSTEIASKYQANSWQLVEEGKKLFQNKQFAEATTLWQEAVQVFAEQGDQLNQAMALSNLSLSYQQLGRWQEAKQAIAQSLTLLENLEKTPQQQRIFASTLEIKGQLQLSIGQSAEAITTWQKATKIYKRMDDQDRMLRSQINQAQAMQDLGLYPRACRTLLTALEIDAPNCQVSPQQLQNLNDQRSPSLQVLGLRSLGNVLRATGQNEQSQQVLSKSWQLAQQLDSSSDLETIYLSLGNTARSLGSYQLSIQPQQFADTKSPSATCLTEVTNQTTAQFYQQAEDCYRQAALATEPQIKIKAQLNLLSLWLQTQQLEQVPEVLSTIFSQLDRLPPSQTSISARLKLAQNLMCLHSTQSQDTSKFFSPLLQSCSLSKTQTDELPSLPSEQEIQQLIITAINQAQTLGDQKTEANANGYLAASYQQIGKLSEAEQLTQKALQGLSTFDSPELVYLWQWQLGRIYQSQNQTQRAIVAYTSAWEILQSLRQDLVATNPDVQFNFRDRVEPVYRELVALLLQPQLNNSEQISSENLKKARDIIESLQLAELNNFFREACIDSQPQQIEQLDPQAAVIYSIALPEKLAVILSVPEKPLKYYETRFSRNSNEQVSEQIDQAFEQMFANLNPYISSPNPLNANQQFYDWLIRPWEAELVENETKTLVFVLDGVLRSLPMAALHDGQQYLVEKYNIALTPSLQLLSSRSLSPDNLQILAAGLAEARQGFASLPGVKQEVEEIAKLASAKIILDQDFTRSRLQQEIEATPFPVVHLATHGQFSSQADNTFLLTWDEQINVKNLDQLLREREGQQLSPIELLILSACQTAAGDKRAVLGLAGVAVRSGARSTLATLWSVQDQSTAELMSRFYENLSRSGVSKAEALRQAQLSLLRSSQYQHPFYWAPFVLVGNWQ